MISVSGGWLDPKGSRPLIEALPRAAALLSSVEEAHDTVLATQAKQKKTSQALLTIQQAQATLDDTHDRKARGEHAVLTGFADLADDPEVAAAYIALRDKIIPPEKGLRVLQMSYGDEAGEALLVEKRLDGADRALLKKLPTPEGSLLDAHKARITAAKKLGELETERTDLENKEAEQQTIKQADVLKARNGWIQMARALIAVIDLAPPSAAIRKRILGPLDEAEKKAGRRGGTKAPGEEPPAGEEALEPEATDGAAPDATPTKKTTPK